MAVEDKDTLSESPEFESIDGGGGGDVEDRILEDSNDVSDIVRDFVESDSNVITEEEILATPEIKRIGDDLDRKKTDEERSIEKSKHKLLGDPRFLTDEYLKEVVKGFLEHYSRKKPRRIKSTGEVVDVDYVYYDQKVREVIPRDNPYVVVNFKDIIGYRNQILDKESIDKLIYMMRHKPYRVRAMFTEILRGRFREIEMGQDTEEDYSKVYYLDRLQVGFTNFDERITPLNSLRTHMLSKFITTEGVISQFDDMPRVKVLHSVWECRSCGRYYPQEGSKQPLKCIQDGCTSRSFDQDLSQQRGEDYLDIRLTQQYSGVQKNNTVDRYVRICGTALVNYVLKNISPGQVAVINGAVTLGEKINKKGEDDDNADIEIDAFAVEQKNNINVFEHDERFVNIVRDGVNPRNIKKHVEKLKKSICSHIYGHDAIKEAVLLQMVGTHPRKRGNGTREKGDINLLVCGPSGSGKSDIGEFIQNVVPHSMKAGTERSTSAAGLTTFVDRNQKTGKPSISLGVLPMVDMKGIAIIEEINRRAKKDLAEFANATDDNQQILVNKGGFHSIIYSRCPIYATANSLDNNGMWNRAETVANQTRLEQFLLQRMDLVFVTHLNLDKEYKDRLMSHVEEQFDNAVLEQDYRVEVEQKNQTQRTEGILREVEKQLRNGDFSGEYPIEYLRHEIYYLKTIKCRLKTGSEAYKILTNFWSEYSNNRSLTSMTFAMSDPAHQMLEAESMEIRKFTSLRKLAEAYGRLYRSTEVRPEHAQMACDLMSISIASTIPQINEALQEEQNAYANKMLEKNAIKMMASSMSREKQVIQNQMFRRFSTELNRFNDILYKQGHQVCRDCRGTGQTSELIDSDTNKIELNKCMSCEGDGGFDMPFSKNDFEANIVNNRVMSDKRCHKYFKMYVGKGFLRSEQKQNMKGEPYYVYYHNIDLKSPEIIDAIRIIATNLTEAYMERIESQDQIQSMNRKVRELPSPPPPMRRASDEYGEQKKMDEEEE